MGIPPLPLPFPPPPPPPLSLPPPHPPHPLFPRHKHHPPPGSRVYERNQNTRHPQRADRVRTLPHQELRHLHLPPDVSLDLPHRHRLCLFRRLPGRRLLSPGQTRRPVQRRLLPRPPRLCHHLSH